MIKKKIYITDIMEHISSTKKNKTLKKRPKAKLIVEQEPISMAKPKTMNNEFIDLLEKLSDIMLKKGEPFRARAYQKAQETIMAYPDDITDPKQLQGLPGIGTTIMKKMNEYVETGTLNVLEREKNNPVNILADIYGVGPKKAKELVEKGITTIAQLRERQDELLNETQKIGLKYYEDILKRIPRKEIDEYKALFLNIVPSMEIVGSYRRGAQESGDIDVIITSSDPKIFGQFLDKLIRDGIIIHVLSRGPTKCLVVAKLHPDSVARRIDFLYTTPEEYPFAVLYFTGSKIFNTVMRNRAQQLGYTMNEHGIYSMIEKKKGPKVDKVFADERSIFAFLGLRYKEPEERIDGRAVVQLAEKLPAERTTETAPITFSPEPEPLVEKPYEERTTEFAPITFTPEEPLAIKPYEEYTTENAPITFSQEPEPEPFLLKEEATKIVKKAKKKPKLVIIEETELMPAPAPHTKTLKKKIKKNPLTTSIKNKPTMDLDRTNLDIINDFKREGISVLESLTEEKLADILNTANVAYRNLDPVMTDSQFDIIQDFLEHKYPHNAALMQIGAPIAIEKNKVTLPYHMASMNKIKPDTGALAAWMAKYSGPYVLSCKLDGVSGMYTTEGNEPKLYTRGDGTVGQDISYLIPYLRLPKEKNLVIRGEFIIPKTTFNTKYKDTFANARNMVSGIVNRIAIDEKVNDMHFVAYEVIKPILKPSVQMNLLTTLNVEVVLHRKEKLVTNELLSELLQDWRKNYAYEIDGVICTDDKIALRKTGNPENAFAFKMVLSDQIAEATVVDVIWTPSKDGYLKPRVRIEPIHLGGVTIEYATGFNGQFIAEHKIGIGSIIELVRSGDVIPHIRGVTMPAEHAKMPDVPYRWNETHVDVMLENAGLDETVREKNITGFFKGIGVDGLSSGNIARIIEAGFDGVCKIIHMTQADFLTVSGFQAKLANKIYNGIREKLAQASLLTLMSVSNIFGRGISEKKIEPILEAYPNVLTDTDTPAEAKIARIRQIKGMAQKTASAFVERIPAFLAFLTECGMEEKLSTTTSVVVVEKDTSHPLFGKTVVMTGFRDEELKGRLKDVGSKLGSSVSKNTFALIVKDKEAGIETGKAQEAAALSVPIYTLSEFNDKYF